MIEVEHLTKNYGSHRAVDDVTFSVAQGDVVGFLGPNGAGKSTTLRIIAGFLGASAGRVRIQGHDVVDEPHLARAALGYMPESAPLYLEMRVREYLRYRAELKLVPRRKRAEAVERSMEETSTMEVADVLIGHLSKGFRQRVGLADALVADPPLLILDEPSAGLDPNQMREVRELIRRLGTERTVLVSTHILSEVESTCTRGLVINRGRLVAEGTLAELTARRRASSVRMVVTGTKSALKTALRSIRDQAGVERATEADDDTIDTTTIVVDFTEGTDGPQTTQDVVQLLVQHEIGVREVAPVAASLEQVFKDLTAPAEAEAVE